MADSLADRPATPVVGDADEAAELQREVWRLRDELIGLQAQLGAATGALKLAQVGQLSAENRANVLARQLDEVRRSRQYRIGRVIVGPLRRLRSLLQGGPASR